MCETICANPRRNMCIFDFFHNFTHTLLCSNYHAALMKKNYLLENIRNIFKCAYSSHAIKITNIMSFLGMIFLCQKSVRVFLLPSHHPSHCSIKSAMLMFYLNLLACPLFYSMLFYAYHQHHHSHALMCFFLELHYYYYYLNCYICFHWHHHDRNLNN